MRLKSSPVLLFILYISLVFLVHHSSCIILKDSGYEDIIVSFSPSIPTDEREKVLLHTEDLFNRNSDLLFEATNGRAYFRNVTFLIPLSWKELGFSKVTSQASDSELYGHADIRVLDETGIFGNNPYTFREGGCGQKGRHIYIPRNFLLELDDSEKAVLFLNEWAKFRYGVFSEGGFYGDSRYPLYYRVPGTEDIVITGCSDQKLDYINMNNVGEECELMTDQNTGRPTTNCVPIPQLENRSDISSLMNQLLLPKAIKFCEGVLGNYHHIPDHPSKHNILCEEQSTWFVILRHEDFMEGKNQGFRGRYPRPSFKYVQESNLRLVLAIDTSSYLQQNGRFTLLRTAAAKFIIYDLPEGSEIGLVSTTSPFNESIDKFPLTKISMQSRRQILSFLPDGISDHPYHCAECAVISAIEVLKSGQETPVGGTIIFLSSGNITEDSKNKIEEALKETNIRLCSVVFIGENSSVRYPELESLSSKFICRTFYIAENFPKDYAINSWSLLLDAFGSAVDGYSWSGQHHPILITQKTFNGLTDVSMDFNIDDKLRDAEVWIKYYDENNTPFFKENIQFFINGKEFQGTSILKEEEIFAYRYMIPKAEDGQWNIRVMRERDNENDIIIRVSAKAEEEQMPIIGKIWMKSRGEMVNTVNNTPVIIYGEVRRGSHPVANANVTAVIYNPGTEKTISIQLLDNGLGDPDITKNDGIYSRYLTQFAGKGHNILIMIVEDNEKAAYIIKGEKTDNETKGKQTSRHCCGSFVPLENTLNAKLFSRMFTYGSFFLQEMPDRDIFPPSRITDLQLIGFDIGNHEISLQWTSPGGDYDSGKASSYQLKMFQNRLNLRRRFNDSGVLLTPSDTGIELLPIEFGEAQLAKIHMQENTVTGHYFFAIRAIDDADNKAEISNSVEIFWEEQNSTTDFTDFPTTTSPKNEELEKDQSVGDNLAIILGSVFGVIILLIIIGLAIFLWKRNRRYKDYTSNARNSE